MRPWCGCPGLSTRNFLCEGAEEGAICGITRRTDKCEIVAVAILDKVTASKRQYHVYKLNLGCVTDQRG